MTRSVGVLLGSALLLGVVCPVQAGYKINFQAVNPHINNPVNIQTAADQISAEVFDVGRDESGNTIAQFLFKNIGPKASALSEIGFEDGTLLARGTAAGGYIDAGGTLVVDSTRVSFAEQKNYPNFGFQFDTSSLFSIGANNPAPNDGLNPGEWLAVKYTLQTGKTYQNLLDALEAGKDGRDPDPNNPGRYTSLRLAIHVIAFGDGGSEKLLYSPQPQNPNPVPAPPAIVLAGLGVICIGGFARLRRRFAAAA